MTDAATIRAEIDSANADIKAATRKGDMLETAWVLVSRKIGLMIVAGDINVKLKWRRL